MLNVLEEHLSAALRQSLPADVALTTGPLPPPAAAALPQVNVAATDLQPLRPADDGEEDKRDMAFFTQRLTLTGNGQTLDFALPQEGELVEVESAPGRLARSGDDYWLEEGRLRFYQPPAGEFIVLLRGKPASGYQQFCRCRSTLEIHSWAAQTRVADDLLSSALAAALTAFASLDRITLARLEAAGFCLRLIKPVAELGALERAALAGNPSIFRSTARLLLRGEWELTLAYGVLPAEGIIQTLAGRLFSAGSRPPADEFGVKPKDKG